MKKTTFWYVKSNYSDDPYEYITLTEPQGNDISIKFTVTNATEMLETTENIAGMCNGDIFEMDGLIPLYEACLAWD